MHALLNTSRLRRWHSPLLLAASLAVLSLPSAAQERLKPDLLKLYGGLYSTACEDSEAPRLRVLPDGLVVQHGAKRIMGRQVQSAYSYYGNTAPPQFRVGLMSLVATGGALDFVIFEDRRGSYISIQGDHRVRGALGKDLVSLKYRRCEDASTAAANTPMAPVPPIPVQDEQASDAEKMLLDNQFRSTYLRALGPLAKERWLARLDGPRPPTRQVHLEGVEYTLIAVCKSHDCADYNTALLYAVNQGDVFGKVFQAGKSTIIGNPPPAIAAALEEIWTSEWRRR